jgi:ferredoxin
LDFLAKLAPWINGAESDPILIGWLNLAGKWRIGGNVPWSVSWTGEEKFDLVESVDFPGLVDLVQVERPKEGSPKFAALHVSRHRLGMVNHLCHVCGRRTLKYDRYLFPVQSGGFVTMSDESTRYAGNVPPVHSRCAERAARLCPHLSHAFAEKVAFPAEETRLMPRLDVVEGMEELAKTLPKGLKVVFSCFRLHGPAFTRKVQAMRAAHAERVAAR